MTISDVLSVTAAAAAYLAAGVAVAAIADWAMTEPDTAPMPGPVKGVCAVLWPIVAVCLVVGGAVVFLGWLVTSSQRGGAAAVRWAMARLRRRPDDAIPTASTVRVGPFRKFLRWLRGGW